MLATCGYQVVEIWQFLGESKIQNLICQYLKSKYRLPRECSPGSAHKESTCNVGDLGSIPGLGRSPGGGKGYPLQYSGLENSMDWIVHGVAKSRTQLSNFHFPWKTKEERKSFLFTLVSVGEGRCRPSALRSKEQRSWL